MPFNKPHLPHEDQLDLLIARGLEVENHDYALRLLRFVGYYRIAAYVYPFRIPLPQNQQFMRSRVHMRSDAISLGTTIEDVDALRLFDGDLRLMVIEALSDIEVALGTCLVDAIARNDIYGHLDRDSFDPRQVSIRRQGRKVDDFDHWLDRYSRMKYEARNEQYAIHHLEAYGDPFPVWIAIQFMDFGSVTRLLKMLRSEHQGAIAATFGIKGGGLLAAFGTQLNYLRNVAAHHNRLWNRVMTYKTREFKPHQVGVELGHAARMGHRDRVYIPLAVIAYLMKQVDPATTWPTRLAELITGFPVINGLAPERDMGFPDSWDSLPLWS